MDFESGRAGGISRRPCGANRRVAVVLLDLSKHILDELNRAEETDAAQRITFVRKAVAVLIR
jgi:hypothetical protein